MVGSTPNPTPVRTNGLGAYDFAINEGKEIQFTITVAESYPTVTEIYCGVVNGQVILNTLRRWSSVTSHFYVVTRRQHLALAQAAARNRAHQPADIPSRPLGRLWDEWKVECGGERLRVVKGRENEDLMVATPEPQRSGDAGPYDGHYYLTDSVDTFLTEFSSAVSSPTTADITNPFESSAPLSIPLGLTFSFPVEQTVIDGGKILTWTKGFSAKNALGKDIVSLLQDAFDRKHLHVHCVVLVNDTVGTLLSRAYAAESCLLERCAIFGTGTNSADVENVENITKLGNSPARQKGGLMIINAEWSTFNNTHTSLPTASYDNKLDQDSINPRKQAFKKFISGMYLGEITRNILLSFIDAMLKPLLFNGNSSEPLNTHYGLNTAVMSEVESTWELGRTDAAKVNSANGHVPNWQSIHFTDAKALGKDDIAWLECIRKIVIQRLQVLDLENMSLRDAVIVRLSRTAVTVVLMQTGNAKLRGGVQALKENLIIGVDGSLIQHYPNFEAQLHSSLQSLAGEAVEKCVEIDLAKDGSGAGATLCALQAIKQGL
ncbi:actin-like ATPase domain-containing protein [Laetiporus sulphureus 93-53]|uniref:Phosphotransferase n=1 Tax=Laetiporus sulphureus 93-53 TaxID=1314785 RepID=A0A165ENH8_9APHY|nr:actin-like ATPase domain-containing protein [Laetiporus sulphureus 93-53]KZT07433.1 actin-like ATPase domain-containing protein [Laetiporus sulphureus 93-53]